MTHRIHGTATLSAMALAFGITLPASANPGLLHKHGPRPVGVPAMLPAQANPVAAIATSTAPPVAPAAASGASSIAVAGVVPGGEGSVAIVGGAVDGSAMIMPEGFAVRGAIAGASGQPAQCVLPPHHGHQPGHGGGLNVFPPPGSVPGHPGMIEPGMIAPGLVGVGMVDGGMVDGGMVDGGMVDGGMVPVDGLGEMPMVLSATVPPGAATSETGKPGFIHLPPHAAMQASTAASASDQSNGVGRALAGGLPTRAVGVRSESVAGVRQHGRGPAIRTSTAEGVAVNTDVGSGRVLQAGGNAAERAGGEPPHDRRARSATAPGQAVVPPGAAVAPRWRDRLRFAWPTGE